MMTFFGKKQALNVHDDKLKKDVYFLDQILNAAQCVYLTSNLTNLVNKSIYTILFTKRFLKKALFRKTSDQCTVCKDLTNLVHKNIYLQKGAVSENERSCTDKVGLTPRQRSS